MSPLPFFLTIENENYKAAKNIIKETIKAMKTKIIEKGG